MGYTHECRSKSNRMKVMSKAKYASIIIRTIRETGPRIPSSLLSSRTWDTSQTAQRYPAAHV